MSSTSAAELHGYHRIDREVFSRLVLTLSRDPGQCLLVMATWLWLEERGFPNIISKMKHLPEPVINVLADESVSVLNCLQTHIPQMAANFVLLPLTSRIMETEISLQFFIQNRFLAITGIKNFLNAVCARIFTDILQLVLGTPSHVIFNNQPLVIPGFPHPTFGALTIMPGGAIDHHHGFSAGGLWSWNPTDDTTEDDRTMFLTFSRGFPVTEDEVRDLFTGLCGDCVENIHMQENVPSERQPLFARLVLKSVETVDQILCGRPIVKFRLNDKHIWARKYEHRD